MTLTQFGILAAYKHEYDLGRKLTEAHMNYHISDNRNKNKQMELKIHFQTYVPSYRGT